MRTDVNGLLEDGRIRDGYWHSDFGALHGKFIIQGPSGRKLMIISSGPDSTYHWEHVSVSTARHIPNWEEMSFVKRLFWRPDECVMQLHPPENEYVNYHPNCLHLWRPMQAEIPQPPSHLVGPKTDEVLSVLHATVTAPGSG